ncbi:MAG TPA: hypothetical protein VLL54_11355 [Pyrinomonadaceae bacterium]|nr:hypothetical protein [Pyrinomonadaceae bacterium]
MPRTPINEYLIHRPGNVDRNAERFDYLCHLAEEASFPVVQEALVRETSATGAELLTDEAKHALAGLLEETAGITDEEAKHILCDVQRSLSDAIPDPDHAECAQLGRDFSQVLMSTWLESLRKAGETLQIVWLNNYLLPEGLVGGLTRFMQKLGTSKSRIPDDFTEAVAPFAVNEEDVAKVFSTLRTKLFSEPRRVNLPFELAMVGAPTGVMIMPERVFEILISEMKRQEIERQQQQLQEREERERQQRREEEERPRREWIIPELLGTVGPPVVAGLTAFGTERAQVAAQKLSKPLTLHDYRRFASVASLKAKRYEVTSLENRIRRAIAATE